MVGATDAGRTGVGTTVIGAIGGALVHSMEARALGIHDVLWSLRGFVIHHVFGVPRKDTTTFNSSGLGLTGSRAEAPEDITGH